MIAIVKRTQVHFCLFVVVVALTKLHFFSLDFSVRHDVFSIDLFIFLEVDALAEHEGDVSLWHAGGGISEDGIADLANVDKVGPRLELAEIDAVAQVSRQPVELAAAPAAQQVMGVAHRLGAQREQILELRHVEGTHRVFGLALHDRRTESHLGDLPLIDLLLDGPSAHQSIDVAGLVLPRPPHPSQCLGIVGRIPIPIKLSNSSKKMKMKKKEKRRE